MFISLMPLPLYHLYSFLISFYPEQNSLLNIRQSLNMLSTPYHSLTPIFIFFPFIGGNSLFHHASKSVPLFWSSLLPYSFYLPTSLSNSIFENVILCFYFFIPQLVHWSHSCQCLLISESEDALKLSCLWKDLACLLGFSDFHGVFLLGILFPS